MASAGSGRGPRVAISINSSWNFVNFRAGLVRALVARGYEVIAVAPRDAHSGDLEALGCRFVELPMNARGLSPSADAALALRYLAFFRKERPDVYLGYTAKPNIYGSMAAHLCGVPVINNIAGLGTAFLKANWLNTLVAGLYKAALGRSATVFFQNPDDRDLFVRRGLVRVAATRLLPGSGVDLDRFAPAPTVRDDGDPPTFLLVARLLWAKGIAEFAEAARVLRDEGARARFAILGMVEEGRPGAVDRATLEAWHREGLIDYIGAASDVRPHLAACDCLVLPTFYPEGTPRVLLEGAAMAKPLLTTDVPGCRQIVDHGVNGFLCRPRDAADLAAKMRAILAMPQAERLAMGDAGRRKAAREFDEKIVIDNYLAALDEALSPASSAMNASTETRQG